MMDKKPLEYLLSVLAQLEKKKKLKIKKVKYKPITGKKITIH